MIFPIFFLSINNSCTKKYQTIVVTPRQHVVGQRFCHFMGHVSLPFLSFVFKYSKVSFASIQNCRQNLIHNTVDLCLLLSNWCFMFSLDDIVAHFCMMMSFDYNFEKTQYFCFLVQVRFLRKPHHNNHVISQGPRSGFSSGGANVNALV